MTGKKISRRGGGTGVLKHKSRKRPKSSGSRRAALTITNGCFAGLEIPLKKESTSLGRAVSCDICLDHAFVSDEHAVIRRANGGYVIEDLNSRHGTSINGREVHKSPLRKGDRITIGSFDMTFRC